MQLIAAIATAVVAWATTPARAAPYASTLVPELLVEAPRPGTAIVHENGSHAIIGVEQASGHTGKSYKTLYHVPLNNRTARNEAPHLFAYGATEAVFFDEREVGYVVNNTLCHRALDDVHDPTECHRVFDFPAPIQNLRTVSTSKKTATLVFSALVYDDGTLEGVAAGDASQAVQDWTHHVRTYDALFVRHWDRWLYPHRRTQLFSVDIERNALTNGWHKTSAFRNLMKDTKLESPVGPLGDATDFAVSREYVAFTAKDPAVQEAWHTKQNLYLVPLRGGAAPWPVSATGGGWRGAPALSPDGDTLAFLQQEKDGFESDRKVVQTYSIASRQQRASFADWPLSPSELAFSPDGATLYLTVVEREHTQLYRADAERRESVTTFHNRRVLVSQGKVASPHALADGRVVFTRSTFEHPNDVFVLHRDGGVERRSDFLHSMPAYQDLDLGAEAEQFAYAGVDNVTAYGWYFTPPHYEKAVKRGEKLPLAVLIHGGPEGDWNNAWSTRWNPKVFAAAGFAVITLDPTGSTGFGQNYTDRILHHWGDRPYTDIVKGVHYILDTKPHLDRERVVAAGASFGGYMVNWIQGHNDDKLFKALVTHDGMFNTMSTYYSTEELYFPESEFGGVPWENEEAFLRFSPHRYTSHWNTPHLIIHGGQDFRLDPAEGISAFTTLQRRGVPSRLVFFPNEGHWVNNPKNSLAWHNEVLGWLTRWAIPGAGAADAPDALDASHALRFQ
ncbi:hypothetical protein MOBT1_002275 [Malassezia obtusa]|uniref:Dipeptidyl-peptidase V n=1 Tax=Malassezia obtusa TaxID=76774 RepID=A0AAF0E4W4_9BASI|nr:hypothetical protein MOBT1_002275 [Malassezia obtusa]